MLRVFISYSRKDSEFVGRLSNALAARGYLPDFDKASSTDPIVDTGIAPTDEWWARLETMIAAADVVVLVVSPDSIASRVVDEEIAYARAISKRLIPVTCRKIDLQTSPPRLRALQISEWFVERRFDEALDQLALALERDVDWLRKSSIYTVKAKNWEASGRQNSQLLSVDDIADAETWMSQRPRSAPELAPLLRAYIDASRQRRVHLAAYSAGRNKALEELVRPLLVAKIEELEKHNQDEAAGERWLRFTSAAKDRETQIATIRNFLNPRARWHPKPAFEDGALGAQEDYAPRFFFPCCQTAIICQSQPSQFRFDGCSDPPE